jgi:hypothetical protein
VRKIIDKKTLSMNKKLIKRLGGACDGMRDEVAEL